MNEGKDQTNKSAGSEWGSRSVNHLGDRLWWCCSVSVLDIGWGQFVLCAVREFPLSIIMSVSHVQSIINCSITETIKYTIIANEETVAWAGQGPGGGRERRVGTKKTNKQEERGVHAALVACNMQVVLGGTCPGIDPRGLKATPNIF